MDICICREPREGHARAHERRRQEREKSRSKEGRFRSDLRVRDSLVEIIDVKLPHKARVV